MLGKCKKAPESNNDSKICHSCITTCPAQAGMTLNCTISLDIAAPIPGEMNAYSLSWCNASYAFLVARKGRESYCKRRELTLGKEKENLIERGKRGSPLSHAHDSVKWRRSSDNQVSLGNALTPTSRKSRIFTSTKISKCNAERKTAKLYFSIIDGIKRIF